jgi:hypothetical protein
VAEWQQQEDVEMTVQEPLPAWPARTWLLAALGGIAGLLIYWLTDDFGSAARVGQSRVALAALVGVAALGVGYTLERTRWASTLVFALASGLVIGSVVYWNGPFAGYGYGADGWRVLCAVVAVGVAAPLFQAWRDGQGDEGALRLRSPIAYPTVHDRAWTDAVLWIAAWIFVGIVWLLAFLLSELFQLIGIDLLEHLLRKGWFQLLMTGAAMGAVIGLLRDRATVLATLQRVAMVVLSVLAPILGLGLLLFIVALPFTGLTSLWDATRSTTPILLSCVAAAIVLVNAVIGDRAEDESRLPALRIGAMILGGTMLVLALIAAISVQARIGQYGFTPDRLWAVVFTGIAIAYGLAYAGALGMGRAAWAVLVRRFNLRLAFGICLLAFILSTPLVGFGAVSARDQAARLETGRVSAARFDWKAMWFDFGPVGRDEVRRLGRSAKPDIRAAALEIQKAKSRWDAMQWGDRRKREDIIGTRLRVLPQGAKLPAGLRTVLTQSLACGTDGSCLLLLDSDRAVLVNDRCKSCAIDRAVFYREGEVWRQRAAIQPDEAARSRVKAAMKAGKVEVRPVTRNQLFIGGEPVDEPFP